MRLSELGFAGAGALERSAREAGHQFVVVHDDLAVTDHHRHGT